MPFRYRFKPYLYHYGLKTGLPFSMLRRVADICAAGGRPRDYLSRRRVAANVVSGSKWRDFFSRETGFCRFEPGDIPGLDNLVEIGQEIYSARGGKAAARPEGNPFLPLLNKADFDTHPEILKIALSRPIVEIMCGYFGTVPRLDRVDLWVTSPNVDGANGFGSQLYHLDKPGQHYTSLFLNVFNVEEENGPLVFLPADKTAMVRRATRYERLYYLGNGRLPDQDLFAHVEPSELIHLNGPSGTGALVDTSECFHCGSRCTAGTRVLFVLSFMPAHKGGTPGFKNFPHSSSGTDSLTRLFLKAPPGDG